MKRSKKESDDDDLVDVCSPVFERRFCCFRFCIRGGSDSSHTTAQRGIARKNERTKARAAREKGAQIVGFCFGRPSLDFCVCVFFPARSEQHPANSSRRSYDAGVQDSPKITKGRKDWYRTSAASGAEPASKKRLAWFSLAAVIFVFLTVSRDSLSSRTCRCCPPAFGSPDIVASRIPAWSVKRRTIKGGETGLGRDSFFLF